MRHKQLTDVKKYVEYKHGFGMKGNQYPPKKCDDCGSKMSAPIYNNVLGPWRVECLGNCGCYYQWQDPWTKHHHLELFELKLKKG